MGVYIVDEFGDIEIICEKHNNENLLKNLQQDINIEPGLCIALPKYHQSLRDRLTQPTKIPNSIAISYIEQLLLGIEYLHNNKIFHRDLKVCFVYISN